MRARERHKPGIPKICKRQKLQRIKLLCHQEVQKNVPIGEKKAKPKPAPSDRSIKKKQKEMTLSHFDAVCFNVGEKGNRAAREKRTG